MGWSQMHMSQFCMRHPPKGKHWHNLWSQQQCIQRFNLVLLFVGINGHLNLVWSGDTHTSCMEKNKVWWQWAQRWDGGWGEHATCLFIVFGLLHFWDVRWVQRSTDILQWAVVRHEVPFDCDCKINALWSQCGQGRNGSSMVSGKVGGSSGLTGGKVLPALKPWGAMSKGGKLAAVAHWWHVSVDAGRGKSEQWHWKAKNMHLLAHFFVLALVRFDIGFTNLWPLVEVGDEWGCESLWAVTPVIESVTQYGGLQLQCNWRWASRRWVCPPFHPLTDHEQHTNARQVMLGTLSLPFSPAHWTPETKVFCGSQAANPHTTKIRSDDETEMKHAWMAFEQEQQCGKRVTNGTWWGPHNEITSATHEWHPKLAATMGTLKVREEFGDTPPCHQGNDGVEKKERARFQQKFQRRQNNDKNVLSMKRKNLVSF